MSWFLHKWIYEVFVIAVIGWCLGCVTQGANVFLNSLCGSSLPVPFPQQWWLAGFLACEWVLLALLAMRALDVLPLPSRLRVTDHGWSLAIAGLGVLLIIGLLLGPLNGQINGNLSSSSLPVPDLGLWACLFYFCEVIAVGALAVSVFAGICEVIGWIPAPPQWMKEACLLVFLTAIGGTLGLIVAVLILARDEAEDH